MSNEPGKKDAVTAERGFHDALQRAHLSQNSFEELSAAASRFCEIMRRQGLAPETAIVNAKRVIEEAIDDKDRVVAERAVLLCIQHYYGIGPGASETA